MSDSSVDKIAFLALGWLLGLLAPIIIEANKRIRENSLGRAAILTELTELTGILCIAAYGARMRLGTTDRPFLEWLKSSLEQYATTPQLSWNDEQICVAAQHTSAENGKGTVLQHYPVPLLDTRVSALWSFDTSFQRQLLDIRREIAILDDVVDRSRKYFDMTFTKLEGNNHDLVIENLTQTYDLYAQRAMTIVDKIKALNTDRE